MQSFALRTHIPENLKGLPVIPRRIYRKYRPEYYEVDPLLDLCGKVVDNQPEPSYWKWTPEEVADWVDKELFHPEFREAFLKNKIDGKSLVLLDADKFPRISIRRFDIIKELTKAIRELCKVDKEEFNRSISLPIRRPHTLYLWYKASRTGPTAYFMTPTKYYKLINIIRDETTEDRRYYALLNHWNRIPPYREWCPHVMIGGIRRINPMTGTTQRQNFHPKDHPYLLKDLCIYHIPC